jgi:cation diffusion facilitator family transporter
VLGLVVNIVSAWLLSAGAHGHHNGHDHGHAHAHDHAHGHDRHDGAHAHHDLNLRAAYLHVIADAATSVLAIAALAGGLWLGIDWLDTVMGLVGTVLVGRWAIGLMRDTGRVLLDAEMDAPVVNEVREIVRELPEPARLRDLHVWRVGKGKFACILSLEGDGRVDPDEVRRRLAVHEELVHVTVEVVPGG